MNAHLSAVLLAIFIAQTVASSGFDANARGLELAKQGHLDEALPFFEQALRSEPSNVDFLNNHGVTLLRLRKLDEAEGVFRRVLEIHPHHNLAQTNLDLLLKHKARAPQAQGRTEKGPKPKARLRLPRIPFNEFYLPKNRDYNEGKLPFIITGALEGVDTGFFIPENLARRFADSIVDFYPHNMDKSNVHPYLVPMEQAVREMFHPSGAFPNNKDVPGTYIQWNINTTDWAQVVDKVTLPYMFQRDADWLEGCLHSDIIRNQYTKRTHWRMALIATKGAGMFGHMDSLRTASWQAQILGAKRWFICAPSQTPYLYKPGEVDAFNPNYLRFPLFAQADCYEDVVNGGDMLYYPMDYWHQTENQVTPSLSVSGSILDENCYAEIAAELREECDRKKYNWGFSSELCSDLKGKCFAWWEARFGAYRRNAAKPREDVCPATSD